LGSACARYYYIDTVCFRKFWRSNNGVRIGVFWIGSAVITAGFVMVIATDWITWDRINRDFIATSELSRAYLCSFVLVMDLVIVMQDWDFPHFTNTLDVNLPGLNKHIVNFQAVEIQISGIVFHFIKKSTAIQFVTTVLLLYFTGKWFNYGIIFLVMIFDLNMWKNQIFYYPEKYGQYIGKLISQQFSAQARNLSCTNSRNIL
jgi:hypothetical protein